MRWNSPKVAINTFSMNDHYPDPGLCWRRGMARTPLSGGTATRRQHLAENVWPWVIKSEDRDNLATYGLIHQKSGGDDVTVRRGWNNEPRRLFKPA